MTQKAKAVRPVEIPALPPGVKIVTLDNGLTIIVREDHSAPVVSAQAWCQTGSIHEGKWLGAGLSYVLEHRCSLARAPRTRGAGRASTRKWRRRALLHERPWHTSFSDLVHGFY